MWRRPRLVTADTKSPAPQPALSGWWRGAFAPDPATGTEAGPGPTTPRRSAVRRASRLRGRAHASQAWRRALLRDTYQGWTSLGAPPIPSLGGRQRRRRKEEGRKPGGKNAPGTKKAALFDIVNRTWRGGASAMLCSMPSRQRQRARVPAERAPRRAFFRETLVRAREPGPRGHATCRARSVSTCAKRNESRAAAMNFAAARQSCESSCSDALSRAALAPQLTDRAVGEPPQIPLAILSQSREAPGQPGAQFIAIVVRKLGIGSDELPRLVERGIDEFSDSRVETCLRWHRLLPYTCLIFYLTRSRASPARKLMLRCRILLHRRAWQVVLISNSDFE